MTRLLSRSATVAVGALALSALVGCSSSGPTTGPTDGGITTDLTQSPDLATPGVPITAQKATWTWVPVDGAVCDDGSATGVGVYLTDSPNLLIFLNGGGACWDYSTCFQLNTSTHGPFAADQFNQFIAQAGAASGTIFSEDPGTTFAGWNKVYIPYCTGDVHAGDIVQTYAGPNGAMGTIHHEGYTNVKLDLARLGATIPAPAKLVFTGSSAGGYGSAFNYIQARATWPHAKGYLIDDSGPVMVEDGINSFLMDGWVPSWDLAHTLYALCPDCANGDWSLAYDVLVKAFPNDRMALLSSEQDMTISSYLLLTAMQFQTDVNLLATMRLDPTANFRYFFQSGNTHTMLGDEPTHTTNGVNVADWINAMVTDDPSWKAVTP